MDDGLWMITHCFLFHAGVELDAEGKIVEGRFLSIPEEHDSRELETFVPPLTALSMTTSTALLTTEHNPFHNSFHI